MVDITQVDPNAWAPSVPADVKRKAQQKISEMRSTKLVYGPDAAAPLRPATLAKKKKYVLLALVT